MSNSHFDLIVFDWKGTLEKKGGNKKQRLRNASEAVETQKQVVGFSDLYHKKEKELALQGETIAKGVKKTAIVRECLKELKPTMSNEEIESSVSLFSKVLNTSLDTVKVSHLYPGAFELLEKITTQLKLPVAMIRNSELEDSDFQNRLVDAEMHKFFDVRTNVVLSSDIGVGKPDPKLYHFCLEKAKQQHIQPHRILFIGNEAAVDIQGAKNAGWKSVLMKHTETTSNGLADWDLDNFDQLLSIIQTGKL